MGHTEQFYNRAEKKFNNDDIIEKIEDIVKDNKERYPNLIIESKALNFASLQAFNQSVLVALMKLDLRKK